MEIRTMTTDVFVFDPTKLILGPDYGRDYKSIDHVLKHWNEHKDFKIYGVYVGYRHLNKSDFVKYKDDLMPEVDTVVFRFNNKQKIEQFPVNQIL